MLPFAFHDGEHLDVATLETWLWDAARADAALAEVLAALGLA